MQNSLNMPFKSRVGLFRIILFRCVLLVAVCFIGSTAFAQETAPEGSASTFDPNAVPNTPSAARLDFEKAGKYEKDNKYSLAIEYYTYCIDNAPGYTDVKKFALYRRASCYYKQKSYDLALRDAMNVPNVVIKHLLIIPAKDAVKLSMQYDHDAYIMMGVTKDKTKMGIGCDDLKKALLIENTPHYKGNRGAQDLIKKFCH